MTCEHIKKVQDKINNLIKNAGNADSYLYEKKGPYVELKEVKKYLEQFKLSKSINMERLILALSLGAVEEFHTISPNYDALYDNLSDIFSELNNCDCHVKARNEGFNEAKEKIISVYENKNKELVEEYNELVVASKGISKDNEYLEEKCDKLDRELRNLRGEKEDEIKDLREKLEREKREHQNDNARHNNEELRWERDIGQKNAEIARLEEKSRNDDSQIQAKDNEIGRLQLRLDQRIVEVRTLENQLTTLRLESGEKDSKLKEKDNELRRKDKEIERLKKWAELSQEELLNEKLRSEKENLKLLATELKINLEKINNLSRYHERLFQARKVFNQINIATHEDNIAQIEEELHNDEISMVHIQEICRKCQRIAELGWELEQVKKRQVQMNDWKNINSNFTLELVQGWIKHGFTIEQCREWVNTVSPWQQNRVIKEPAYYAWLRDVKKVNAEWVLNQGNEQELGQEFFQWCQEQQYQAHQEQPTNH